MLDTWVRSPARLREDANAEESLALVGYAGRVIVELAANAADAAIEAGVPGRVRITLVDGELRVANNGAPLTAAGVASLASLRASAKRDDAAGIGHFGVGFTAVLALSDHPSVVSTGGAVTFSPAGTAAAIAGLGSPALDAVVADRDGHVPVLRLPWPVDGAPPYGYATEVRLPLLPSVDAAELLAEVGDHLLLALPGLEVVELPGRTLRREESDDGSLVISDGDVTTRWRFRSRIGRFDESTLAGLPTEQRRRREWRLTWAFPQDRELGPDVLYSPTPTDEALSLPARLIGTFPVDDTRRHLAPGPITDQLLVEAVAGYLELMADTPAEERLRLLPPTDFGRSEVDNRLRQGIWAGVRETPLLVSVAGDAVRPDQATVLPGASAELLMLAAEAIPGLLPAPQDGAERDALRALGVRTIGYPELSTALGALSREAAFWGRVYAQLEVAGADDLSDLPVPLAGGRTVLGARGCLVVEDVDAGWLTALATEIPQLRVVHPDAAASAGTRRVLLRIGAQPADPTAVLADPAVLQAAALLREELETDDVDDERIEAFGVAVLDLVAAGATPSEELRAELLLTTVDGEPWPVDELLLPDAPLAGVLSDDADFEELGAVWTDRYDHDTLQRAGVLVGFRVLHDDEPHGPDHDLPDENVWWDEVIGDRQPPATFTAIADLDLVDDARWPRALELIRTDRRALDAVRPYGDTPSYSGWWLSRFALIGGEAPRWWRTPGAVALAGLYDPLPEEMDPGFAAAIGVRTSLESLLVDDPEDLLFRFTDVRRTVAAMRVPALTSALVAAMTGRSPDPLPPDVRTMSGRVVDADDAVVLDQPWLAEVLAASSVVPGGSDPAAVARFFDLELASERYRYVVVPVAGGATISAQVRRVAADFGLSDLPDTVTVDTDLRVREAEVRAAGVEAADGPATRVRWWSQGNAAWVDGSAAGWGRLLAHRAAAWPMRHAATASIAGLDPDVVEDGLAAGADSVPPGS